MNLLSFLSDPLYDVNFLAKKHIHVVSPIEFDVMVDSSFFPYPELQYWGGNGRGKGKKIMTEIVTICVFFLAFRYPMSRFNK